MDENERNEVARLTGWHLGTARPAIMPPLEPCELAGYWYDANGTRMAAAFTDALMGVRAYTVHDARARVGIIEAELRAALARSYPIDPVIADAIARDKPISARRAATLVAEINRLRTTIARAASHLPGRPDVAEQILSEA
jgi:hypothetical protein